MLDPARFAHTEHKNNSWTVTVEEGTSIDDVIQPAFFANVAVQFRPYDKIYVRVDTGEWYAELLVLACDRVWAKVAVLRHLDFTEGDSEGANAVMEHDSALDNYKVQYRGPHNKFSVIRKVDNQVLKEQLDSKAEAYSWLEGHLKTLMLQ